MSQKQIKIWMHFGLVICLAVFGLVTSTAWAQTTTTGGNLNVSVVDQSGGAVPNASLELKDLSTNVVRKGATQPSGLYSFQDVAGGTYSLTVTSQGFATEVFSSVIIKTSLKTDVHATLKVGTTSESVTVTASEAPIVQMESSTISSNIDAKQVFELPVINRDVFGLAETVPGYTSGTFDNLPGAAIVSAEIDGTQAKSNRFRSDGFGYGTTDVQFRMENVEEFTVTTQQLDLSGNGSSAMRISVVNKRGSNQFHGLLYEDFRNTVLNANSWSNNANTNANGVGTARPITKYNQFGGTISGPIFKDKLFFFGNWSELKNPGTSIPSVSVLTPTAQSGIYSYINTAGGITQYNLFNIAKSAGLPSAVNQEVGTQLSAINGVLGQGLITPNVTDPNVETFTFTNPSTNTTYYPSVKIDYNQSNKMRWDLSYNQNKSIDPNTYAPNYPTIDTVDRTSYHGNNKVIGLTNDYTITPTLLNNLHLGYLYEYSIFDPESLGIDLSAIHQEAWGYGESLYGGSFPRTAISSMYSMYDLSDSLSWQHGKHAMVFGFSGFREWDRYWNGPGGEPAYGLGLASTDPAYTAINNAMAGVSTTFQGSARALYGTLVGDIDSVNISVGRPLNTATGQYKPYGQYNLNEVQQSEGLWAQDRWHVLPTLTLNFGLRWDIVGADHDKDGYYTSARSLADIWGPTTLGAMFSPGALNGVQIPEFTASQNKYGTIWKNPEPAVALAWNPHVTDGFIGKLLGGDKTVIRTGYSLRNYQDGAQNFWAFGSEGLYFYQQGSASPSTTPTTAGTFAPGSLYLGSTNLSNATPSLPNGYLLSPTTWSQTILAPQQFGSSEYAINPHIRLPYVQSWNFGIQRQLTGNQALEVDYVGNLTLHSWLGINLNEPNIFESGYLTQFKEAQSNMALNVAAGNGQTPFNFGLPGQVPLPMFTAALGTVNNSNWTGLSTNLTNGAAGTAVRSFLSTTSYLCNLIGNNLLGAACPAGTTANGAGYPNNILSLNPWAKTGGLNYLDAAGMSNYEALQVQYRTRLAHGVQVTVNYTLGHAMYNGSSANIQSQSYTPYTLRNLRLNYLDSPYDVRHVLRIVGTYDLPFGKGRHFMNIGGPINAVLGGWTFGTITSFTAAGPSTISGGYDTVTNTGSGVNFLGGLTAPQFQSSFTKQNESACTSTGCTGWVQSFQPQYVAANNEANPAYFTPATTPGVFSQWPIFRTPLVWTSDGSLTKNVRIHERMNFILQVTATDWLNHPTIGLGSLSILSTSFGRTTPGGNRQMELRANLQF